MRKRDPDRCRALDVILDGVADHDGLSRVHPQQLERGTKDRLVRLDPPCAREAIAQSTRARGGRRSPRSRGAVRDHAELEPAGRGAAPARQGVVVEVEVLGEPQSFVISTCEVPRGRGVAAHAADDQLGEGEPHLLVMAELRMALDLCDRPGARLRVAVRVELEPVLATELDVPLGAEVRPRLGEGEVDVEEHGPQLHREEVALACGCGARTTSAAVRAAGRRRWSPPAAGGRSPEVGTPLEVLVSLELAARVAELELAERTARRRGHTSGASGRRARARETPRRSGRAGAQSEHHPREPIGPSAGVPRMLDEHLAAAPTTRVRHRKTGHCSCGELTPAA